MFFLQIVVNCILLFGIVIQPVLCSADNELHIPFLNRNQYSVNQLLHDYHESELLQSNATQSNINKIEKNVDYLDKTVKEVEEILKANSSLPRLTRGEILQIIENITKYDEEAQNNKSYSGLRDQKAIMLVMPYTPDNMDNGRMQELYTKPPVTRIINEVSKFNDINTRPTLRTRRRPQTQSQNGAFYGEVFHEHLPISTSKRPPLNRGRRPTTSQSIIRTQTTEKYISTSRPKLNEPEIITLRPSFEDATTRHYRGRSTAQPPVKYKNEPEIITLKSTFDEMPTVNYRRRSTTTTERPIYSKTDINNSYIRQRPVNPARHPNHKYSETSHATSIRKPIMDIPSYLNKNNVFKPVRYTTAKPYRFTHQTAEPSVPHHFTTSKPITTDDGIPEHLKATLDELNIENPLTNVPIKPYVEPINPLNQIPSLKNGIEDILSSIESFSATSTTTIVPDISNVADTLTPDMKELLMSFGLLPDPNFKKEEYIDDFNTDFTKADLNSESYIKFKPLPDNGPTREDMQEFLEQFGLGRNSKDTRKQRNLDVVTSKKYLEDTSELNFDMVPESMRHVLIDLGLSNRNGKTIKREDIISGTSNLDKVEKDHVFKPMETSNTSEAELEKLNQLLDIIKQLEKLNRTVTEEDLTKIDMANLSELVNSLNNNDSVPLDQQQLALDPLNFDTGIIKNEVKRQESSTPSTTISTTEASTPNLKDLEDSFGGAANTDPPATIPAPTSGPKTGFYYLLDWNSFLDIDDQKGKRVNLRFQPKAGDPQQFIHVAVP